MTRKYTAILTFAIVTIFLGACKQSDPIEDELLLVWSDEFDGDELDNQKWEAMIGNGSQYGLWGWGNGEEQYYLEENASVSSGFLRIKAIKQPFGEQEYTSARLRSLNMGDFKYGRVEASIRMDAVEGLWHAFWMLPSNPDASWPVSGELDIMEYVGGSPNELLTTIHFADQNANHAYLGEVHPFLNDNEFHLYSMEWDENQVIWFIDNVEVYVVNRSFSSFNAGWPFDAKFHMLLNVAVGGNLGGNVNDAALSSPRYMYVDYVRVFQKLSVN
ncbi:MAG: beta-glucanase (GH16 family) [Litorivivens sp.]|jgi:beta-glucanase (GH16 family)